MTHELRLAPNDRVLIVLPHPDDESLATAGLIQQACAAGAEIRLLFATDGDNNPWAQRVVDHSLWITSRDRARFGAIRRGEVLAALSALGVPGEVVSFQAFPDQGLTALLMRADEHLQDDLRDALDRFRPTVVASPSALDRHPDHSALGVVVTQVLRGLPGPPPRDLRFFIHDPERRREPSCTVLVRLDTDAIGRKRAAIECHRTQRFWRGAWLTSFARPEERFYEAEPPELVAQHPVRRLLRVGQHWHLDLASRSRARSFGPQTLLVAGLDAERRAIRVVMPLWPRFRSLVISDPRTGATLGTARLEGNPRRGTVVLPEHLFSLGAELFAKIEHSFGFFDEAGWRQLEIDPPAGGETQGTSRYT